jgi:hypothetical protein
MTQPPNPISQGFRAARRDPATFLMEILWRWSFWAVAALLLCMAGMMLMAHLGVSNYFATAWKNRDDELLGEALVIVMMKLGWRLAAGLLGIAVGLGFFWSILAAAIRRVVVKRLSREAPLGFGAMLAVQATRALVALMAVLLLAATFAGAVYAGTRGSRPDLFRFYLVCAPALPVIVLLWLGLNWRLSMAAIFGREGQWLGAALRQARQTVRRQRSDFAGTAFIFLLLRLVGLLAAVAIGGLTSHMLSTAPQSYFALIATVALGYFVLSDFLYVARIASYLALAAQAEVAAAGPSR